jgi:hypothetical protein
VTGPATCFRAGAEGAGPPRWRATALAVALAAEGWLALGLWRWLTHD